MTPQHHNVGQVILLVNFMRFQQSNLALSLSLSPIIDCNVNNCSKCELGDPEACEECAPDYKLDDDKKCSELCRIIFQSDFTSPLISHIQSVLWITVMCVTLM